MERQEAGMKGTEGGGTKTDGQEDWLVAGIENSVMVQFVCVWGGGGDSQFLYR